MLGIQRADASASKERLATENVWQQRTLLKASRGRMLGILRMGIRSMLGESFAFALINESLASEDQMLNAP